MNILETVRVTKILHVTKNVQNDFLHPMHEVYIHLEPGKRGYKWQSVSFKLFFLFFEHPVYV